MSDGDNPEAILAGLVDAAGRADCLVVVGGRGSGRTRLAALLARHLETLGQTVLTLSLKAATGREGLRTALALSRGQDDCADLESVLQGLVEPGGGCLIIDDAGYLTVFALQSLLAARARAARCLRLVLLADPAVLAAWRASPSLRAATIASMDIPRLTESEAREIIETLSAGRAIDERVVGQILRSARGRPGPLREATLAALNGQALGRPNAVLRPRGRAGRLAAATVVPVLLATGAWWYLGHDLSRVALPERTPGPPSMESPAAAAVLPPGDGDAMTAETTATVSPARPSVGAPRTESTGPSATTDGPVARPAVPTSVPEEPGDPAQERKRRPSVPAKPGLAKVKAAQTGHVVTARPESPVAKAVADQGAGGGDDRSWLSRQPATAFTIQLVTFRTEREAARYLRKKGISGLAALIETSHRGRPLFLVVYGSYPDRKAALEAASRLPKALRRYKPWIRSIAALRRVAIRSGAGAGPPDAQGPVERSTGP